MGKGQRYDVFGKCAMQFHSHPSDSMLILLCITCIMLLLVYTLRALGSSLLSISIKPSV